MNKLFIKLGVNVKFLINCENSNKNDQQSCIQRQNKRAKKSGPSEYQDEKKTL